jgi:cystinosin
MAAALLPAISTFFGWSYTLCWSLSFYPQALLNARQRSTAGTTADFPTLNVLGFGAYLAYTAALLFSPRVRALYAARNPGAPEPTVRLNDVVFALHALVLSVVTASQYFLPQTLWGFPPVAAGGAALTTTPPHRLARAVLGIILGSILGVAITILLAAFSPSADPFAWSALDVVYALSYVKLLISLVKYTPQVLANRRNRSTRGWSIWQPLLDLAGGVLSVAQIVLDSWLMGDGGGDWSGITGNPVKFALGNTALVYDAIFMVQHYVLYPQRGDGEGDVEGQVSDARRERRLD